MRSRDSFESYTHWNICQMEPPRRFGRPTLEEAAGLRNRVMEETLGLLRVTGISGLSVDEVARLAGVTKRTIYRQFGSKSELVDIVVDQEIDRLQDGILSSTNEASPIGKLQCWARSFFDYVVEPDNASFLNYLCFESIDDPCLRSKLSGWQMRMMDIALQLIGRAQKLGELPLLPPERLAGLLIDLMNGAMHRRRLHLDELLVFVGQTQEDHFRSRWNCFLALANGGCPSDTG
ncbi:MAG: TetR/AcrR family transcriptional regulator [Sphingomonadales bacterium]|nr:MAG: TetR/AcrR family transcriptional regulator [Sphingomonadales bacterium]